MSQLIQTSDAVELAKAAPPVAVQGAILVMGIPLNDWVAILTIVYLVFQLTPLVIKYAKLLWGKFK